MFLLILYNLPDTVHSVTYYLDLNFNSSRGSYLDLSTV